MFAPLKSIVVLDYAFSLRKRLATIYTQDPLLSESYIPRPVGKREGVLKTSVKKN